uniref:Uncharacterized protein n=1 Tax=Calcidiscus leptoporus TaxID=127549 RepID=A0A7S0NXZ0_9EUKA
MGAPPMGVLPMGAPMAMGAPSHCTHTGAAPPPGAGAPMGCPGPHGGGMPQMGGVMHMQPGCGGAGGPMRSGETRVGDGRPGPHHRGGGRGGGGGGGGSRGGRGGGGRWGGQRSRFDRAKNDYAQHFVDTGLRPANFIRDSDVEERFEEYPKLKELVELKDQLISERATPPTYKRVDDLKEFDLTTLGTKFDVVLVDPPWEEYRRRRLAAGHLEADETEVWTPQEIMALQIEKITDTPSFCFLWSGSGVSLQWGRACLRKWGYRRCEDISWIKSNRETGKNINFLPDSVVTPTTEHCLVGIKGTVRRNYDGHIIHANVDTDVMLSEEPPYGSTEKPTELYSIIEHFCNCRRRLELFGEDHNLRRGWLTLGKDISSSNHDPVTWAKYFEGNFESCSFEGEPANMLPNHLLGTTPTIESLRPKSPTQLREEAERRLLKEHREKEARQRAAAQREMEAAREMGLELDSIPIQPESALPTLPAVFQEQHPFNVGANSRS